MKRIVTTTILALTLALSGAAVAYTPTPDQCHAIGAVFNTATQGCDARRDIAAVPGVTYWVNAGDVVYYGGTIIWVRQPGTITFCPCSNW